MFFQSCYILYVRSKTKKIYQIGLNGMGLIQLDRANHCGLCYFLYSIIAMVEIICEELVRSGLLDQKWPNFILGIKFTVTVVSACVILWLCICHCALVKQSAGSGTSRGRLLTTTMIWALNISLVMIVVAPTVNIVISFSRLTMEYQRIREVVMPVIHIFRTTASTCTVGTCSVSHMIPQVLSLTRALQHIDLLVHYTQVGTNSYVFFDGCILAIYIPFLCLSYQSLTTQRGSFRSTKRQQDGVFANTLIEFTIILCTFILTVYTTTLVQEGNFIFNPTFWLLLRIGINSVISNLGNIALFLIAYSLRKTNVNPPNVHIAILESSLATGSTMTDANTPP